VSTCPAFSFGSDEFTEHLAPVVRHHTMISCAQPVQMRVSSGAFPQRGMAARLGQGRGEHGELLHVPISLATRARTMPATMLMIMLTMVVIVFMPPALALFGGIATTLPN
jgi:hypothetical protein